MKPRPLYLQLYTLRDECAFDLPGVIARVASYGFAGVEFAGLYGQPPEKVRALLDAAGLAAVSGHGDLPSADSVEGIATEAHVLGYDLYVCSWLPPETVATAEACARTAEALQKAAQVLGRKGLRLALHNHQAEFSSKAGGVHAYEAILSAAPDVLAQVDTYYAALGGADVPAVLRRLGRRVVSLHIKDGPLVPGRANTAVGSGAMAWDPIMAAVAKTSARALIVELENCDTPITDAARESAAWLIARGYGGGRG